MRLSFSYTLLITWFLFSVSCLANFIATSINTQNISVSEEVNESCSELFKMYLPYKKIFEKDVGCVILVSEVEMVKDSPISRFPSFPDCIIGGFTHLFVEKPIVGTTKKGQQGFVNQAWRDGLVVGKIDMMLKNSRGKKEMVLTENI